MFPVLMYAAPSGLSLYFITNSVLAIGENKWIRHHMHQHGLLDPDKLPVVCINAVRKVLHPKLPSSHLLSRGRQR